MNREIVHGLAALACLATSVLALPARAQAIQEYMYEPDKIYTVRTGLGITTQIEPSPNEKIIDYSNGDRKSIRLNSRQYCAARMTSSACKNTIEFLHLPQ